MFPLIPKSNIKEIIAFVTDQLGTQKRNIQQILSIVGYKRSDWIKRNQYMLASSDLGFIVGFGFLWVFFFYNNEEVVSFSFN